jgi:predicted PilT family ATPase
LKSCVKVQINFPAPGEKRDVVTVRGPKEDVDQCARYMTLLYKEMLENSFQIKVPVFPQTYALVVGKANKNIRQIREETGVRMDLPPFDERKSKSEAEIIVITGRKENCEQARDKILELQSRLVRLRAICQQLEVDMKSITVE